MEIQQLQTPPLQRPRLTQVQFLQVLLKLYKRGDEVARRWLLEHFADPANIDHFATIFSAHVTKPSPDFHRTVWAFVTTNQGHKGIAAPRGFAKTTITDVILLAWYTLNAKKNFIVLISDTFTQSALFLDAYKAEMENNPIIRWLYGSVAGPIWTNNDLIVYGYDIAAGKERECRIMAKGAGMKVRGLKFRSFRPDLIILDDLENDELVESPDRRQKLRQWFTRGLIPALSKEGEIIIIGTILHYDSLLKNIIDRVDEFASWTTKRFQAITDGNSLWPEHYTVAELNRMRDDPTYERYVGPLTFAQEYQNEPMSDTDRIIQPDWMSQRFKIADEEMLYKQQNPTKTDRWIDTFFKKIICGIDPAISEKETADYFAMITIGVARESGHIYILDYFKERIGDPLKQVEIIIASFKTWRHDVMKIETVAYQKGLFQLVRRIGAQENVYPTIAEFQPDKDKVRRARIHSANFAGHLVHLREDHPLFNSFYNEVLQFPLGSHDDMFDAYMNAAEEMVMKGRARTFNAKPRGF